MSATLTRDASEARTKALEAVRQVEQKARERDTEVRITRRIEVGHAIHQGDVYIHHVEDNHERGAALTGPTVQHSGDTSRVQIALGTGNGAKHIAEGKIQVFEGTKLPSWVTAPGRLDPKEMTGPVIVAQESWCLTHPEHAHHQLPAGVYQTTYQYDPRTMKRVID